MGIGKQAKILNRSQVEAVLNHINGRRYGLRNQVIFLLSIRAGLRAKEIAALRWSMIVGADGEVGEYIHLTNDASKGMSGRIIPINRQLKATIIELFDTGDIDPSAHVIRTERSAHTSAQAIGTEIWGWWVVHRTADGGPSSLMLLGRSQPLGDHSGMFSIWQGIPRFRLPSGTSRVTAKLGSGL
jgi:integrase/recombinase XerD